MLTKQVITQLPVLQQAFEQAMGMLLPKAPVVLGVAVSGGSDSLALTLLASQWIQRYDGRVVALTVDHGLREASAREAKQVGQWLETYGIEHHILSWQRSELGGNIQAEARHARYELLSGFCRAQHIPYLLVAHTLEDQAETVLMRLMRGSGVDGLSAMAPATTMSGMTIIRPLLEVTRSDLRQFLTECNQQWVEDPSNDNLQYARVNVRRFLDSSPDKTQLIRRLADTAGHMARSRAYIERSVAKEMAEVAEIHEEGYAVIRAEDFARLHEEAGLRILARVLMQIGGHEYKPRFESLQRLYSMICQQQLESGCTLWGCQIISKSNGKRLLIIRELAAIDAAILCRNGEIWDGRFAISVYGDNAMAAALTVSALGKQGYRELLKVFPLVAQIALPKSVIYTLPALRSLEKLVAVPHIGYTADEQYKGAITLRFNKNTV